MLRGQSLREERSEMRERAKRGERETETDDHSGKSCKRSMGRDGDLFVDRVLRRSLQRERKLRFRDQKEECIYQSSTHGRRAWTHSGLLCELCASRLAAQSRVVTPSRRRICASTGRAHLAFFNKRFYRYSSGTPLNMQAATIWPRPLPGLHRMHSLSNIVLERRVLGPVQSW